MVAATIVRGAQDGAVQKLFASIGADARPAWQRAALLRGAEVALLGAAGAGQRRRAARWTGRGRTCRVRPVRAAAPARAAPMRSPQAPPAAAPDWPWRAAGCASCA